MIIGMALSLWRHRRQLAGLGRLMTIFMPNFDHFLIIYIHLCPNKLQKIGNKKINIRTKAISYEKLTFGGITPTRQACWSASVMAPREFPKSEFLRRRPNDEDAFVVLIPTLIVMFDATPGPFVVDWPVWLQFYNEFMNIYFFY